MTVYFNQTLDIPYAGMILRRNPVNISVLAGNDDIVLILYDPSGSQYDFSIAAGQKILQRNFDLFRFEITGSGQAAVAISYPEVIEPSIEITLNPNLPQSVSSLQLPAALDSNGFFKIRYLGGSDVPGRGWTLGSGDTPSRSWTLGASDVPNRGWNLGSLDVPGRGWTLGSSDVPNRGWNLGSLDVPGRGWTLGSGDTPNRSWSLASTDNPDVTQNQANPLSNQPNLGGIFVSGSISASLPLYEGSYLRITYTVPAYGHLMIKKIIWNPDVWDLLTNVTINDSLSITNVLANITSIYLTLPASTSFVYSDSFLNCVLNNQSTSITTNTINGSNPRIIILTPEIHYYNDSSTSSTFWIELLVTSGTGTTDESTGNLNIIGEGTANITWQQVNYNASTGTSSNGSSGSGGCWSADSWFIDENMKPKAWRDFRIGDLILTPSGLEPIEAIYEMGTQETFEIDQHLRISRTQPFKVHKEDSEQTILDVPELIRSSRIEKTYDCKVKSLWLIPYSPRIHAIKDISKKA